MIGPQSSPVCTPAPPGVRDEVESTAQLSPLLHHPLTLPGHHLHLLLPRPRHLQQVDHIQRQDIYLLLPLVLQLLMHHLQQVP